MANETQKFVGYKVSEAIPRFADRDLLRKFVIARRKWLASGGRTHFKIKDIRRHGAHWTGHNQRERAAKQIYEEYLNSQERLCRSVQEALSTGAPEICGRRGSPAAPITVIPASALPYLRISSYPGSVLVEKTKEGIKTYDVRIFAQARKGKECSSETEQHSDSYIPAAATELKTADTGDAQITAVELEQEPAHVTPAIIAAQEAQTGEAMGAASEAQQKAEAENACYEWLMRIFRASPTKKRCSKPHLKKLALAQWNALSERGFLRVWDKAVRDANATAWSRSGRLEKSPHPLIAAPI